jgi:hypothetical protein
MLFQNQITAYSLIKYYSEIPRRTLIGRRLPSLVTSGKLPRAAHNVSLDPFALLEDEASIPYSPTDGVGITSPPLNWFPWFPINPCEFCEWLGEREPP